jgi:predicted ATP-grasp superfamily ATP-dependent carboligase
MSYNSLVMDGGYKHTLGIVRALGKEGHASYVLSNKSGSLASKSKYCKGEVVVDSSNNDTFIQTMVCHNIACVLPVGINSFKQCYKLQDFFKANNIFCPIADEKSFEVCISKYQTFQLAEKLHIPVPKTIHLNNDNVGNVEKEFDYPCVLKAEQELGGSIVKYIYQAEAVQAIIKETLQEYPGMEISDFILQEFVEGEGYGFFAVYNNGKCGKTFQHRRLREMPPSGGYSVAAESVYNDQLFDYGKRILDVLDWHGVAMVEFKRTSKGEFVLMEINPKFWGSLDLALEAGVNFPNELIKLSKNEPISFSKDYPIHFKYHWPLHGDVLHAILNPKNLWCILLDTLNPLCRSNLWVFDDIKPTLYLFFYMLGKVIRKIF